MGKGGNKARESGKDDASRRSEDTKTQNVKDEAVSRDPDIGGVMKRQADDVHKRDRRS
jgi:hypothetical protein